MVKVLWCESESPYIKYFYKHWDSSYDKYIKKFTVMFYRDSYTFYKEIDNSVVKTLVIDGNETIVETKKTYKDVYIEDAIKLFEGRVSNKYKNITVSGYNDKYSDRVVIEADVERLVTYLEMSDGEFLEFLIVNQYDETITDFEYDGERYIVLCERDY